MAQLLQNIYNIAPILLLLALLGAAAGGFWLVIELKKRSSQRNHYLSERLCKQAEENAVTLNTGYKKTSQLQSNRDV
jgi:beta-lactamase regulating signal transducer with metallopeptidase domain